MKRKALSLLPDLARLLLAIFALWLAWPWLAREAGRLYGQNVYTQLNQPAQVAAFTRISDALICQCGCHFVLSSCPHVECPWGIPVRRIIEAEIRAGQSETQILNKLERGFGPALLENQAYREILTGHERLSDELIRGYGPAIRAHASSLPLVALVVAALAIASLVVSIWLRRNRMSKSASTATAPGAAQIDQRLDDLDR